MVCCNLKGFTFNFNPVANPELSSPSDFHFAVYPDPAIQDLEFCFNAVLGNIGKLQELGKTDGLYTDGNFRHISAHL